MQVFCKDLNCTARVVCCPPGGFASRDTAVCAGQHRQLWQSQACAPAQCLLCGEPLSRCAAHSTTGKAAVAHAHCYVLLCMLKSRHTFLAMPEENLCGSKRSPQSVALIESYPHADMHSRSQQCALTWVAVWWTPSMVHLKLYAGLSGRPASPCCTLPS